MEIHIRNADGKPIYDQIYTQIKEQIVSGVLKEGEGLPSLRELARDLRISVITTKRAYEDLERDGFICSVQGKGSFVAPRNRELIREEMLKKLEHCLTEAAAAADLCGMSDEEVFGLYRLLKGD